MSDLTFPSLNADSADAERNLLAKILTKLKSLSSQGTALVSAARTVGTVSSDIATNGCKGIILYLNVTAAGAAGGLRVALLLKDPLTGSYRALAATNLNVTATGLVPVVIYPGSGIGSGMALVATNMGIIGIPLGATIQLQVIHATADSYTYSLAYELIP